VHADDGIGFLGLTFTYFNKNSNDTYRERRLKALLDLLFLPRSKSLSEKSHAAYSA
jgi:hypothetical protein